MVSKLLPRGVSAHFEAFCSFPYRLLGEETPGGPSEGGAGGVPGHGGAFHPAVQQHAEKVRGAGIQHLLHPGHAQQALQLGVVSGQHHRGRHLPS